MAHLRMRLLSKEHVLLGKVKTIAPTDEGRIPSPPADTVDRAADSLDEEIALRIIEIRTREIVQIEEALQKIREGTYGICTWCGASIPPERLELVPEATLCIVCQRESERAKTQSTASAEWFGGEDVFLDDAAKVRDAHAYANSEG